MRHHGIRSDDRTSSDGYPRANNHIFAEPCAASNPDRLDAIHTLRKNRSIDLIVAMTMIGNVDVAREQHAFLEHHSAHCRQDTPARHARAITDLQCNGSIVTIGQGLQPGVLSDGHIAPQRNAFFAGQAHGKT